MQMESVKEGVNVQYGIQGNTLIIKVDLSQDNGPSKSGKTTTIASTKGNKEVQPGVLCSA